MGNGESMLAPTVSLPMTVLASETRPILQVVASFTCKPIECSLLRALANAGVEAELGFTQYAQVSEYMLGGAADSDRIVGTLVILRVEDWLRAGLKAEGASNFRQQAREHLRVELDDFASQLASLSKRGKPVWFLACPSTGWIAEAHKLATLCQMYTNLLIARARDIPGVKLLNWPGALEGELEDRGADRLGWIPFTQRAFDQLGEFAGAEVASGLLRQEVPQVSDRSDSAVDLAAYLVGLKVRVGLLPADNRNRAHVDRTLRTAATFSLSGEKMDIRDAEIDAMLESGGCMVITVADRLSDHGPSGVVTFRSQGDALIIESMALSCAVMGKEVEYAVVSALARIASDRKLANLVFEYEPTARNHPTLTFLQSIAHLESGTRYVLPTGVAESLVSKASVSAGAWSVDLDSQFMGHR
ncbi:MAG: hypothetical protein JWO80_5804 [Bryobacterales bacterium]|nr:hypothetical protein [Bryobacterales bacterium]